MKKEIRIDELRVMMLDALTLRGIGSEDADFIVDDFLDRGPQDPRRLQIPDPRHRSFRPRERH